MEEAMSELNSRQAARERILKQIQAEVDRLLPADPTVPLQGRTFLDFENVAEKVSNDLYVTIVEERVMLAGQEKPTVARCPHCSSPRLRKVGEVRQKEIRTPRGVAAVEECSLRCRDCGRTFSPGAAGVVDADRGGALAQGGGEGGAGGGGAVVR
jgi:DNA-directed RNA polymerase subunit RPC12/RpoP